MRKWILLVTLVGLMGASAFAQKMAPARDLKAPLTSALLTAQLEPYYASAQVAELCRTTIGCRAWAQEQYRQDHSFKVLKITSKYVRRVERHSAKYVLSLKAEAVLNGKKVTKIFFSRTRFKKLGW